MKKIILLVSFTIIKGLCFCQPVNFKLIQKAAETFLNNWAPEKICSIHSCQVIKTENQILAYNFQILPRGFMIVTANYLLPPVVVYSFENELNNQAEVSNPLISLVKEDLIRRLNYYTQHPNSNNNISWSSLINPVTGEKSGYFEQWPPSGTTPTGGWLVSNWHQNAPYNNLIPTDPSGGPHSVAGCPAVAMGMILNFHKTTNQTRFSDQDDYVHNYTNYYTIDDDWETYGFPSFLQLNEMLDTLDVHYKANKPITSNDKAALTFACGTAARQVYSATGSGTFSVTQAYEAYLRFGCDSVVLLDTSWSDGEIRNYMSLNIKDTLPVHFAVVDPAWSYGHNVVVDGYNTNNYFHINFGWGGSNNGWYLLPEQMPVSLTVIEGVVVDIMKKYNHNQVRYLPESKKILTIFPNPGKTCINFRLNNHPEPVLSAEILNLQGQTIQYFSGKQVIEHCIALTDLIPGIYLIKVTTSKQSWIGKMTKE